MFYSFIDITVCYWHSSVLLILKFRIVNGKQSLGIEVNIFGHIQLQGTCCPIIELLQYGTMLNETLYYFTKSGLALSKVFNVGYIVF